GRLVNQQRTLIGTLRALGYARSTLIRHYLAYGLAVGTIGGLLGIMLGIWLQSAMVAIYRGFYELPGLVAHHYWDLSLIGLAISLLFAALGSLSGVRRATQLQPAEAMRPPAPQRGGHILLESVHPLWRRLNFRWRSILRSVFR
ncbi:ABC transporter permease, partial [Candidatus Endoriftia persephone str. Guaymas]|nr:ABC transporter permease [Candidatus Endoriftia persephone str. Guaymas]